MALDHYIPQVHLRNFYAPELGRRMYAFRKSDGKTFTPDSASVCRVAENSSNSYLVRERAVEDFLRDIEPKYNGSVQRMAKREFNRDSILTFAGFVAFVMACSPAGMRIHSGPLKASLETTAKMLDSAGLFPKPPDAMGGENLTDLLDDGTVQFTVDPKYPQALGISNILANAAMLGNSTWEILFSDVSRPFFTSDYPVAIERTPDSRIVNRLVPLTPTLAIRIRPNLEVKRSEPDLSFANFRYRFRVANRPEVSAINRLIVQCAEDCVFAQQNSLWVAPFVKKYSQFRIQTVTQEMPQPKGKLLICRQRILPWPTTRDGVLEGTGA